MAEVKVRVVISKCLGKKGRISLRRDVLALRDLAGPRSLLEEIRFLKYNKCLPEAPTGLRVVSVGQRSIEIAWFDRSDNEHGFRVHFRGRMLGKEYHDRSFNIPANKTTHPISNLRDGHEYTIKVAAFNGAGQSSASNSIKALPIPGPTAPKNQIVILTARPDLLPGGEGILPYLGQYPSLGAFQPGRLLQVRHLPFGAADAVLYFVKPGKSFQDCSDLNAVVTLPEGASTTPDQLLEIFGSKEPRFSLDAPLVFAACRGITSGNIEPPHQVRLEIRVILD